MHLFLNMWFQKPSAYPQLSVRLPDADADVVAVRADHCAHGAHAHSTLSTVYAVDLMVLLAPPAGDVLHGWDQSVTLEDRGVQVRTQVLRAHRRSAHQARLDSQVTGNFRAVVAGHEARTFYLCLEREAKVMCRF